MKSQKNNVMWGIRTITPRGKLPTPVRVGVWVKVRVSFRVGGNQTIALEEKCPLVRVRVWVRVNFKVEGAIFLGDNCFRTVIWAVPIISLTGSNIIWYACDERKFFFQFIFASYFSGGRTLLIGRTVIGTYSII